MKSNFYLLVFITIIGTTSCNLFWNKISETIEKSGEVQSGQADSLRQVIISQKANYAGSAGFNAKMDTVYASGFRLADLSDSLKHHPEDMQWHKLYNQELKFFRNYVNRNFEYDDAINSGLTFIGAGEQFYAGGKRTDNVPVNMQGIMTIMIKPQIMEIIIHCRKQFDMEETPLVSTAF